MAKFLVDANLPYFFSLWNHSDFVHLKDIRDSLSDGEVWPMQNSVSVVSPSSFAHSHSLKIEFMFDFGKLNV